ncbi:MAG: transglycosylase SLT domain-containing protein [Desulfobacterales bacterium]
MQAEMPGRAKVDTHRHTAIRAMVRHQTPRMSFNCLRLFSVLSLVILFFSGCAAPPPPRHIDNVCDIFGENGKWYKAARKSYKRWGIPIHIQMALLHQESKFESDARPPRTSCLWIFPGPRPSSAYGYAQAIDATWKEYQKSTGRGGADRDDFGDAVDFAGWYSNRSHKRCGISKQDAYGLYLAYHEGHGGYNRKTYKKKAWLLQVARKVEARAQRYKRQLESCEGAFRRSGFCLWPF